MQEAYLRKQPTVVRIGNRNGRRINTLLLIAPGLRTVRPQYSIDLLRHVVNHPIEVFLENAKGFGVRGERRGSDRRDR